MSAGALPEFSYAFYERLLRNGKATSDVKLFSEVEQGAGPSDKAVLLLRHDLDLSLSAALPMARLEHRCGVRATYMPLVRCPLYAIDDEKARRLFLELLDLGHDIGLHFDPPPDCRADGTGVADLEASIDADCAFLEAALGRRVESVSFHRPLPNYLGGPIRLAGRVNAYAEALMGAYCSDSKGTWRTGDPLKHVSEPKARVVQLLTHPIWWGETHLSAEQRLQQFYDDQTRGLDSRAAGSFDDSLAASVPAVRRSGRSNHHPEAGVS